MRRSTIIALIGASALFGASLALAQSKAPTRPVVAVFAIETSGVSLAPAALERLSELLGSSLAASPCYRIIPPGEVRRQLRSKKAASYRACHDRSCQIEVGRELAAQKSLSTKILRLADECTITSILFDLERATSDGGGRAEGGCSEQEVARALRAAVAQIVARAKSSGACASQAPATDVAPRAPTFRPSSLRVEFKTEDKARAFDVVLRSAAGKELRCASLSAGKGCKLEGLSPGEASLVVKSEGLHPIERALFVPSASTDERVWVYTLGKGSSMAAKVLWIGGALLSAIGGVILGGGLQEESTSAALVGGALLLGGLGAIIGGFAVPDRVIAEREDFALR